MWKWKAKLAACVAALVVTQAVTADLTFQAPAAAVPAPAGLTGTVIPPSVEKTLMFSDRGRTYLIGLQSLKISFVDGTNPQPVVPPGPVVPPAPSLTGLSKSAYESVMALPIEATSRKQGAVALAGAINTTLSQIGGLGITDAQQCIDTLANNAAAAGVNDLLRGFQLGTLLSNAGITTKEQLVQAMEDVKKGLEAVSR